MNVLSNHKWCYSADMAEEIPIARSTLSQHLKELKLSGLIQRKLESPKIKYCIQPENWNLTKKYFSEFLNHNTMKKITLFILLISLGFLSQNMAQSAQKQTSPNARIEVLYFHATNRCPTCLAVESNAKKTIEENFKQELTKGTIKFVSINIDDKANEALVKKYQVAFSTLLIIRKAGASETKTDLTDMGFQYARNNPTKYAELLKAEILKKLKS